MKQKTISKEIIVEGKGLHYGEYTTLTIKPSAPNSGYIFKRTDVIPNQIIEAVVENVGICSRCTSISKNNISIFTIEHLLAATYSLGIDNVLFEINGKEVPILDGNAKSFIDLYKKNCDIIEQEEELKIYDIKEIIPYINEKDNVELILSPAEKLELEFYLDFKFDYSPQVAKLTDMKDFEEEISKARTFVYISDIENLVKAGQIKGGDINNAIVIVDKEFTQKEYDNIAEMLNKPKFKVQKIGEIFNHTPPYYENEQARHKLLDLLGDLSLIGYRFNAHIKAKRSGHYFNTEFAKQIRNYIQKNLEL